MILRSLKKEMKLKISKTTRVAKAGIQTGNALIEMVNLMYLNDNALEFLNTIIKTLTKEFNQRRNKGG